MNYYFYGISKFKIKKPKIKILGLNPHAGENGKIGSEEKNVLLPAIKKLRKKKILVQTSKVEKARTNEK